MKHKTILTAIIIIIAFAVNAQPIDVEADFKRSVSGADVIDFGLISGDYAEKAIKIKNRKPSPMKIKSISFSGGGIGVTIEDDVIKTRSKSNIIVTVHPKYIKEEEFVRYLLIKTEFQYQEGIIVIEETVYKIKGTIKKE